MILSKSDLQRYLELDRRALGIRRAKRPPLTGYRVWKFQVALRKHEYYANTGRSLFGRIMKKFWAPYMKFTASGSAFLFRSTYSVPDCGSTITV